MTTAPVESSKLNQRRRAVYTALRSVLGSRPALIPACFRVWERDFAGQPHFVVTRYVRVCAEQAALDDSERMLLTRRIFELLAQPYDQLEPYPNELVDATTETIPTADAPAASAPPTVDIAASALPPTAAALVTGAVARSLLSPVRAQLRSKPEVIGEILTDAFRQTRLASSDHLRALNWARAGAVDDSLLGGMTDASLKMLVQGLYVAACDALGPVAADRLLAQSIARAQSLPAAVEFSPDQLL
jgi:hypothetical protein